MINKLHLPDVCFIPEKKWPEKLAPTRPAWILGEEYVHELSGVVCSATISRFRGYCGAYSHWKFMDVPEIESEEPVTLEQCRAAKKGFYRTPDGKRISIATGETVLYQFIEDGSITVHPTNTYCEGVSLPLHQGTVADQSLILTQIRFSLLHEVYLRTRGGRVAAKHSKVSLPTGCASTWCVDGPKVYLVDEQAKTCPFKRIRPITLRTEEENLLISDDLAMLFNVTKKDVLLIPGCPQLTLHHTALETVSITFDKSAAGLPEVVSLDVRSDQDLIPTLKYLEHQNARALVDMNNRVENGGCSTWLNIHNDKDYLHPLRREPGVFARRLGEIVYEYSCKMLEVPIAEAPICFSGIPVLVRGIQYMSNLDTRVITPHLSVQPCNDLYPTMVKSTVSGWISVATRVLQVKTPAPMEISSSYKPSETLTTLYTMEELQNWEHYQQLPAYEKSQHQRLLNALCNEESCSYGGQSALAGMGLEEFQQHIKEGSEAMLASLNPFGFIYKEIEHLKAFLNTMLLLEYSILTVSVLVSVFLYGATATLGALITRLTLNWALLKNRKTAKTETVQMERLLTNVGNQ